MIDIISLKKKHRFVIKVKKCWENNKNFLRITQLVTEIDMLTMTLSNADGDAL